MTIKKRHWRIEVAWDDSTILTDGGWRPVAEALSRRTTTRCHSVGYVLADDKHGIVLAASVHQGEAAGVTIIPRGQIVSLKRLR